jgi:P-type Cu2+ transporter
MANRHDEHQAHDHPDQHTESRDEPGDGHGQPPVTNEAAGQHDHAAIPHKAAPETPLGREATEHGGPERGQAPQTAVDAHAGHSAESHAAMGRAAQGLVTAHADHGTAHADHTGHEERFRKRFWVSLLLSIPVLLFSPMLQMLLRFSMPGFPGSDWIEPLFSVVIFLCGGVPFLQMAVPELQNGRPGMMTLISLAISVAFVYSLAALVLPGQTGFFWELVTLIDIMLLGHWIEMRSVRQASGALNELARLMPDTAERVRPDGGTETVPVDRPRTGDLVLVRPGASVPADGEVVDGNSDVS